MQPLAPAPDLLGVTGWRNVDRAVDLRHDLAGQVILLVFFAPDCIHSRQALAVAAMLDARFATRPLAVLGVCSPQAGMPADADALIAELGLRVPIALDGERRVWTAYECQAWPTLALVDGTGRLRFVGPGEPNTDALLDALKTLLAEVEYGGLGYTVPPTSRRDDEPAPERVCWPDGLAVDVERGVAMVADTAHHRLLQLDLTQALRGDAPARLIGLGVPGASDGAADVAAFASPRGVSFDPARGRWLVADAANHTLREVARDGEVTSLLGSGARGRDVVGGGRGVGQTLAWPWATAPAGDTVWFTLAGLHQVWAMSHDGQALARAGTGLPGFVDGLLQTARLCAPRGLLAREHEVFVADAGNHALRRLDLARGQLETVLGGGPHAPGDVDGDFASARLCVPSALLLDGDGLLVADTGNGKLKRVDFASRQVTTILTGVALTCPAALARYGEQVLVLDRARPGIAVLDLLAGTGRWLDLSVALPPQTEPSLRLRGGADCSLKLRLRLPRGASVHHEVGVRVALSNLDGQPLAFDMLHDAVIEGDCAVVRGVATAAAGAGRVRARLSCYIRHGQGLAAHPFVAIRVARLELDTAAPTLALWDGAP